MAGNSWAESGAVSKYEEEAVQMGIGMRPMSPEARDAIKAMLEHESIEGKVKSTYGLYSTAGELSSKITITLDTHVIGNAVKIYSGAEKDAEDVFYIRNLDTGIGSELERVDGLEAFITTLSDRIQNHVLSGAVLKEPKKERGFENQRFVPPPSSNGYD